MNAKRAYFLMLGSIGLVVVLFISVALGGRQLLHDKSAKLMELKLDNAILDQQQSALGKANRDLVQYSELGTLAKSIVPQDKDQAKTVREILNIAAVTDIPLTAISFPASTLGAPVPKAAATTPGGAGGTTVPTAASTPFTQVKPVENIKGLYKMEIVVQSDQNDPRPYANLQNFLTRLEQNRRTAQVSQLVITPFGKDISLLSFSLTINVFVKP